MTAHAKLSASGSSRWLNCPGSVEAEDGIKDKGSFFAQEGTCAHELAELVLAQGGSCKDWVGKTLVENNAFSVDQVMVDYVQVYVDYVKSVGGFQDYERRVDYSEWVPGGFGTSDCLAVVDDTLYVIDLKYGKGVKVDAFENTQGILYALGAWSEMNLIHDFDKVRIVIVQPRLDHIDEWELGVDELMRWGAFISERAELALSKNAERVAGEKQCQWCKAKATCPALESFTRKILINDFDSLESPDKLTDQQLRDALDAKKLIIGWLDAVESLVTERLESGEPFEGFKLVAGRSLRKWGDESVAARVVFDLVGEDAYEKKLISPAKAEKILGKSKKAAISELVVKPEGKPTLTPESDKRPAINLQDSDFDVLTDN